MQTAKLRRMGLWGGLLLTLYLAFDVSDVLRDNAGEFSEPVRRAPDAIKDTVAANEATPVASRREWREEAHGDPFQTVKWYVAPEPERERSPPPQAPPLPFVYFGKMAEGALPYAFLQKGNKVHVVKAGDTLEGLYRVESISPDAVIFVYLPLSVRQSAVMGAKNSAIETAGDQRREVRAALKAEFAETEEKVEKGQDE